MPATSVAGIVASATVNSPCQPSIAGLVLIAASVGLLGGMTAPRDGKDLPLQLHVGL
jgi:hypothetical protein